MTEKVDTSEIGEIQECYREIRAKVVQRTQRDRRVQRRLLSKYGKREKGRTIRRIHCATKNIIERALAKGFGIVMEKLKGIRRLYRRGNGQGKSYRGRMNSRTFREFKRQVEYKAVWAGIQTIHVNARGTSSKCPNCGTSLIRLEGRKLM
jgi:putative transposase